MNVKKAFFSVVMVGSLVLGMMTIPGEGLAANGPTNNQSKYQQIRPNYQNQQLGRMGLSMGQYFQGAMHDIIAEKLGMTSEELYQARLDGKTIAELIEKNDIDAAEIVDAVIAERESTLAEMVKSKTITEDQKKVMLANMEAMINSMLQTEGTGTGFYRGVGCPMMPGLQPGMGRGRMGAGPMWW